MIIDTLPLGPMGANCYMLKTDKAAVVIDPGEYSFAVENFLNENSDKQCLILLTHCHFDHICGAERLRQNTGVKIAIGEDEEEFLKDNTVNLSEPFGIPLKPFSADITFSDLQEFSVGDIAFTAIKTSGHTKGGICYLTENNLFSGDTLFFESIGRTDFPGGSFTELQKSVQKLYMLDESTTVYPGHGQTTNILHEKKFNPYVR